MQKLELNFTQFNIIFPIPSVRRDEQTKSKQFLAPEFVAEYFGQLLLQHKGVSVLRYAPITAPIDFLTEEIGQKFWLDISREIFLRIKGERGQIGWRLQNREVALSIVEEFMRDHP